jgi:flagellin-like hook-associated protein FlgL
MSITKIGSDQAVFNLSRPTNAIDPLTRKSNTGRRITSAKEGSSRWVKVSPGRSAFHNLQAINSSLNLVAMSTRVADLAMETMETYIDQMKAELERIIKNYPPFPPGSEERVKFLRSFTALRRQIDQLSFAPDYKQDLKITADSMNVPRAGDWKAVVGNRGSRPAIPDQQVSIDATGLNIPELSENATDAEIQAAIESLQDAKKALAQKRSELATNALSIQQFLEFNTKFDESFPGYPEALKSSGMTEGTAENKSSGHKQTLMIESAKGLTEDPSQLLELLK